MDAASLDPRLRAADATQERAASLGSDHPNYHPHQPRPSSSSFSPTSPTSETAASASQDSTPGALASPQHYATDAIDSSALDDTAGGPLGSADPKKPRACEACRGLKVRCDPVAANPDGPV